MDIYSKNKALAWTVIALVVLNLFTVGIILFRELNSPLPLGGFPDRPMMGKGMRVMRFLASELQLSDEQMQQFEQMRGKHFRSMQNLDMEINRIKRELMNESFLRQPDSAKISAYSREMGILWSDMARLNYDHFRQVSSIMDTTQLRKFKELVQRVIPMHGPPGKFMSRRGWRRN